MSAEHRLHPAAERELAEAASRYEDARPGWGARFVTQLDGVFARIATAPNGGTLWRGGPVRTWRVGRFPYLVIYLAEAEGTVILALAHTKRRPGYWLPRVR